MLKDTEFDTRPIYIIRLVIRFYNGFLLLVASLAFLSLGFTMLGLSQADGLSGPALMTAALLASADITAIGAVTIIGVLQFRSHCVGGRYERSDLIMSWVPLFLFDIVMLQTIAGLLLWCTNNFPNALVILFALETLTLLIILIPLSLWVRRKIRAMIAVSCLDDGEAQGFCCDKVNNQDKGPGIA